MPGSTRSSAATSFGFRYSFFRGDRVIGSTLPCTYEVQLPSRDSLNDLTVFRYISEILNFDILLARKQIQVRISQAVG